MKRFTLILKSALMLAASLLLTPDAAQAHYNPRGLEGGTVTCGIHFDGFVFLGTAEGGVYISTNTGLVAWRLRAVGLKSGRITSLTHNGTSLYAATADSGVFVFNGSAGGNDLFWNASSSGLTDLRVLSILALDANHLLAGTQSGLFRSTDAGATWTAVADPAISGEQVTGLAFAGGRAYLTVEGSGLFYSDDSGVTWSLLSAAQTNNASGLSALSYNVSNDELAVTAAGGLYLFSSASTAAVADVTDIFGTLPAGTDIRSIANNGTAWYLATDAGVFSTPSDALGWTVQNDGLGTTNVWAVVAKSDAVVAGTAVAGVFKAAPDNLAWESNNTGFSNVRVFSVACLGDSVVVTACEQGLMVSRNIASSYTLSVNGLGDHLNVNDVMFMDNVLFAATENAGIYRSLDTGSTWASIGTGLLSQSVKKLFHAFGHAYAIDGAGNVYRWTAGGSQWQTYQEGLPMGSDPVSMAFLGNTAILGTLGQGVFVREHGSSSWSAWNSGLGNLNVTSVAASGNMFFAGTDGNGVFRAEATGGAWESASEIWLAHFDIVPLTTQHITNVQSFAGFVLASYRGGIAASTDNGDTWVRAGHQFHLPSYSLFNKFDFVTSRIFITTEHNSAQTNSLGEFNMDDTLLTVYSNMVTAPEDGLVSYHSITASSVWEVSADQPWVSLSSTEGLRNGELELTIAENTGDARTATVTLVIGPAEATITVMQDGVLSAALVEQRTVRLFPNPSNGQFRVEHSFTGNAMASLLDLSGRELMTMSVTGSDAIHVDAALAPGIYLFRMTDGIESVVTRVAVR